MMDQLTNRFTLLPSGNVGQEIVSPIGIVLAWTTDADFGRLLVNLLNERFIDEDNSMSVYGEEGTHNE